MLYNQIRLLKRVSLIGLTIFSFIAFILGYFRLALNYLDALKWLDTSGQMLVLAGLLQLEISGFFDQLLKPYENEEDFPFGPPSYIVREIIDDPSRPFFTWWRNAFFFNVRTGFWFIVTGSIIQIIIIWL